MTIYFLRPQAIQDPATTTDETIAELLTHEGEICAKYRVNLMKLSWRTIQDEAHPVPEFALYVEGIYITGQHLGLYGPPHYLSGDLSEIYRSEGWMPESYIVKP